MDGDVHRTVSTLAEADSHDAHGAPLGADEAEARVERFCQLLSCDSRNLL